MTRNWILGASASAVLHGGAAVMLLTSVDVAGGAPAAETAQTVIQLELVSTLRSSPGLEAVQKNPAAGSGTDVAETPEVAVSPETTARRVSAAAPLAATSPASSSAAPDARIMSDYYRQLESHLARYHAYPASLAAARPSGTVQIGLIVRRDGKVMDVWIQRSSGVASLDQAALAAVRRAEPLPVLPVSLPGAIDLIVPLNYEASPATT